VLVDGPKLVRSLDQWGLLPVAVAPFASGWVAGRLADLHPERRARPSDDGMALFDLRPPAGSDWREVAAHVRALPGVLDHGLFEVDLDDVLVGEPDGRVERGSALVTARS
jgi:ribose 5-phosphate isomerase